MIKRFLIAVMLFACLPAFAADWLKMGEVGTAKGGITTYRIDFESIRTLGGRVYYIMRRQFPVVYTYDQERKNWRGKPFVLSKKATAVDSDHACGYLCAAGIVLVAGLISIFTF